MSPLCGCFMATVTLCVTVMASQLPAPQNVQLTSYNLDLYLRWSPPKNETSDVLYSTQLWATFQSEPRPRAACVNTTALHCELTDPSLGLNIMEFGQYQASVRAQCGAELSEWVDSQAITMDRDTVIGPPDVSLVSNGADLEVIVRDPKFHISTMAHVFGRRQYNISYWPHGHQNRVAHELVQQNRAPLSNLEPWTEYCVQVSVLVNPVRNQNPAEASEPVCASTKDKPSAPWLAPVLTFFALALAVVLVVVAVVYHQRMCHFVCPRDPLPQHLPECPQSLSYLKPEVEVYHPLCVMPGQCTEELHHSRQVLTPEEPPFTAAPQTWQSGA